LAEGDGGSLFLPGYEEQTALWRDEGYSHVAEQDED